MPSRAMLHLTYRFRLLPSRQQHLRLDAALEHSRQLQNAALEERIGAYQKANKAISYYDQCAELTELRRDGSPYTPTMERWPLKQVDLAFRAFFRRLKERNGKAGFPRFRGLDHYKTFGFTDVIGWGVQSNRLRMKGIGAVRIHFHRPFPGKPIACRVTREGKNWFALLTAEVAASESQQQAVVGIDLGIVHLATLSTGEHIGNPRHSIRMARKARIAARALARCKNGSSNRRKAKERLARVRRKEANARSTYLHQVSADLTGRFSTIVIERLAVQNMTKSAAGTVDNPGRNVRAKAGLNRSILDAAFGRFGGMLRYKAERAGGELIQVDPRHTSQTCSICGVVDRASRRSQSRFQCVACGFEINADWNAARNIALRGGVAIPGALNLKVA